MKKILLIAGILIVVGIGAFLWKGGATIAKISTNANVLSSIVAAIPGIDPNALDGESSGRVNVVLLGMRGENDPAGGSLTDTIIVVSYLPERHQVTLVSVPRDLAIDQNGERINKIYYDGEQRGRGQGLAAIREKLGEVTGQKIHYAVKINFAGFRQLVDALDGIVVTRETEFVEPVQFHEAKVCDGDKGGVFTVPTGTYEVKFSTRMNKVKAQYPLCYNKNEECGGVFKVPAGTNRMDGETALCYVRSRVTSSDFDRAKRQQEVIDAIQRKALSVGTLADFTKVNALFDALGNNIQTDMSLTDMQRFFGFYKEKGFPTVADQKVLDSSEEGLLYVPEGAGQNGAAFILRPRGDNYDRIHELFDRIVEVKDKK